MKRVLAISWSLPPLLGARSVQVARTLSFLAARGWKVTAVSVNPQSLHSGVAIDKQLAGFYLQDLDVIRINAPRMMIMFQALRHYSPGLALLPDDQVVWSSRVVAEIEKRHSPGDFDILLTFGHPWSDHLAGLAIKRALDLPWLAHFSDPWADNPYYQRLNKRQRTKMAQQEASVIDNANAVVFTSRPTIDLVMQKYPAEWKKKTSVIPHGYDSRWLEKSKSAGRERQRLRVVHTGSVYGLRSLKGLMEALVLVKTEPGILEHLDIVLVGRIKEQERWQKFAERNGISGSLSFVGQVSYGESLMYASTADVLMIIDAPSEGESVFLPSKLVDYLMYQKPILGLTPDHGATASLLRRLNCVVIPPLESRLIAQELISLLSRWRKKDLNIGRHFARLAREYDMQTTTDALEALLLSLMDN
ncbi:MAG: glycosyltransferase [Anaerolineales bacterium]